MSYEIIDFHTHPFFTPEQNICKHKEFCDMSVEQTVRDLKVLGIIKICGAVLCKYESGPIRWEMIEKDNENALTMQDILGNFFVPGFQIHPDFVYESCAEIERMEALGLRLIGELVPKYRGLFSYDSENMDRILDCAEAHGMIVNFHSLNEDAMDHMVEKHPHLTLVAAHPGEYDAFMRHMDRMRKSRNYFLDLSSYGILRHGVLRHGIDLFGPERFIFGSDYPTCNPAMYVGGVALDPTIKEEEKQLILAGNAKRLLGL